jgi:hypothetical protein
VKVGDLVRTISFGPFGEVGVVGIVIEPVERWGHAKVWTILFNKAGVSIKYLICSDALEVLSEA